MPLTGGTSNAIANGEQWALEIDATRVYFKTDYVTSVDKTGANTKQYAPITSNDYGYVAVDATNVYWADYAGGKIRYAPK